MNIDKILTKVIINHLEDDYENIDDCKDAIRCVFNKINEKHLKRIENLYYHKTHYDTYHIEFQINEFACLDIEIGVDGSNWYGEYEGAIVTSRKFKHNKIQFEIKYMNEFLHNCLKEI